MYIYIYTYICIDSSLGGGCIPIPVFFQQLDDGTLLRENLQEPHEDDDDELADAPRYVGSISPLDIRWHLLRRYLDPQNRSKTPWKKDVFGMSSVNSWLIYILLVLAWWLILDPYKPIYKPTECQGLFVAVGSPKSQLIVGFGGRWFGIRFRVALSNNPFHRGYPRNRPATSDSGK